MRVELRAFDDVQGAQIFRALDIHDQVEAELVHGANVHGLGLFAEWRAMEAMRVVSFMAVVANPLGSIPFAVIGLGNTGQAGVGQAALLSRNHAKFRTPLARLGVMIRRRLPAVAQELGIHRIECRCWRDHPTASKFLEKCGFTHEANMAGFGSNGAAVFRQFAWIAEEKNVEI